MIDKIEEFLFDIIGLILPGFIVIFMFIMLPIVIIDFSKISIETYSNVYQSLIISVDGIIGASIFNTIIFSWQFIFFIVLVGSYILGHTIKVLSKFQYEFLGIIFDDVIIYLTSKLLKLFDNTKNMGNIKNFFYNICKFNVKIVRQVFCFKTMNNYDKKIEQSIKPILAEKLNIPIEVFNTWYNIYKFANIILAQKKIKTLSFTFLAKYNFYRSLAFIFFINTGYIFYEYYMNSCYISQLGQKLFSIIVFLNFLLWFTFHEKYKRYWALCGNESLISLYYYLQSERKDIKKEDE